MMTGAQPTDAVATAARILIADDVPANVELLRDQLELLGYRIIVAVDGPSSVSACFAELPDLCILDVSMPAGELGVEDRVTGFEVCRRIKRDPRTSRIPVIFVTALSDSTDRVRAIEAGGDDFLTKPHNRLVLGARVRSLLKLKAATDALEESLRRQRELERMRDDLMKMIVHDLKTPLTAVLASLEMVLDGDFGKVTEGQGGVLAHAYAKAEDLLTLIDDLLEISRMEDSRLHLVRSRIEPQQFLEELLGDWSLRLRQENCTSSLSVSSDALAFDADRGLLTRVLSNLVQNAVVHAGHPVAIQIEARGATDAISITVRDNGPGISPQHQELIFRKFESLRTPQMPRVRGSGLGLTFCRLAVEAHGGRIWVESESGKGSTFHIKLPLRAPLTTPTAGARVES